MVAKLPLRPLLADALGGPTFRSPRQTHKALGVWGEDIS